MVIERIKQTSLYHHALKLRDFSPAIFFVCGFAWDARTFGGEVSTIDLLILTSYLLISALILYLLSQYFADEVQNYPNWFKKVLSTNWPYFILQFLYTKICCTRRYKPVITMRNKPVYSFVKKCPKFVCNP